MYKYTQHEKSEMTALHRRRHYCVLPWNVIAHRHPSGFQHHIYMSHGRALRWICLRWLVSTTKHRISANTPTRPSPPSFTGIHQMTMEHQWYQPKTARGATDMSIHHMRAISDAPPPLSSVECRVDWVASAANARLVRVGRYNGIYVA